MPFRSLWSARGPLAGTTNSEPFCRSRIPLRRGTEKNRRGAPLSVVKRAVEKFLLHYGFQKSRVWHATVNLKYWYLHRYESMIDYLESTVVPRVIINRGCIVRLLAWCMSRSNIRLLMNVAPRSEEHTYELQSLM